MASFFTRQFALLNALVRSRGSRAAEEPGRDLRGALIVFGCWSRSGVLVGSEKELALHRPNLSMLAMRSAHYVFFNWQNVALFFAAPLLLLLLSRDVPAFRAAAIGIAAIAFALVAWRMTLRVGCRSPT